VSYDNERTPGAIAQIRVGDAILVAPDPATVSGSARAEAIAAFRADVRAALDDAGYPAAADPDEIDRPLVVAILFVLVLMVTAVYGPIAALLVELFPTRIRYTSMSLPYHIGNGWF